MALSIKFEASINEILGKARVAIKDEAAIKKQLDEIIPKVSVTDKKHLQKIMETTVRGQLLVERKKEIQLIYPKVLEIVKKYEEEYEEEENTDSIEEDKSVEEVETLLDEKIPIYQKYTKENPMEGVNWDDKSKSYRVRYEGVDIKLKDLEEACQKVICKKVPKNSKKTRKTGKISKKHFTYQDHYFLTYWLEETPYFDIQHIISALNVKKSTWYSKYDEFKENIKHIHWHKNAFKGYIERELIDEETTYQIILSSNSTISKSFKKDVAKILVSLRKDGKLEITNDSIKIDKGAILQEYMLRSYMYTSVEDVEYARILVANGSLKPISKYLKKHVLYAFILTLSMEHEDMIVKFGYTQNIANRYATLKSEYNSGIYLVGVKQISGEDDEQVFHKLLKEKYNQLIEPHIINKKKKVELYKLNPVLMKEFEEYNPIEEQLVEPKKIDEEEEELIEYMEKQKEMFTVHISQFKKEMKEDHYSYLKMRERTKQVELEKTAEVEISKERTKQVETVEKTKQEIEKTKQMEIEYNILKLRQGQSKKK
jgi:hypothetical protein